MEARTSGIITIEEGCSMIYEGIKSVWKTLERGEGCDEFNGEKLIELYTIIFDLCTEPPPHNHEHELFGLYKKSIEEYVTANVVPALRQGIQREYGDDEMRELVRCWETYKVMLIRLSHIFNYLDYRLSHKFDSIDRFPLSRLSQSAVMCFRGLVYDEMRDNVKNSVIALIDQEREGEQIDRALLRSVVVCIEEIAHSDLMESPCFFIGDTDYNETVLEATAAYYSGKPALWSAQYSLLVYLDKVEQCLKHEEDVVAQLYFYPVSEAHTETLLHKVKDKLLSEYGNQFLEKEHSSCLHALFREEKIDDLSRIYRLFSQIPLYRSLCSIPTLSQYYEIPKAFQVIANILSEHVTMEGTALVKQRVEADALRLNHMEERDNILIQKIIDLLDKYLKLYVKDVFQNEPNFEDALPKALASIFSEHLAIEVTALVKQEEDALRDNILIGQAERRVAFVQKIIDLHDLYLKCEKDVFQTNTNLFFNDALKKAFVSIGNSGVAGLTSAELLASYCDHILKKGGAKFLSHDDMECTLLKTGPILRCESDKDLLAAIYTQKLARRLLSDDTSENKADISEKLARRLLSDTSEKLAHEWTMFSIVKDHCDNKSMLKSMEGMPTDSMFKMEGMLKDLAGTRTAQDIFRAYLHDNPNIHLQIDFTVNVLSSIGWPSSKFSETNLPSDMVKCLEVFEKFYSSQSEGRKLTWNYSLGTCDIIGWFEGCKLPTELTVTTSQAATLLLFNSSARLSYSDIKHQLNLPDEQVVALLHSLACGKYKILLKEPNNETVTAADSFELNTKFRSTETKIEVPHPIVVEEKKVIDQEKEDFENDKLRRPYVVDAFLVRTMKNRKVLLQQELVSECIQQVGVKFKPEEEEVNCRIEKLIEMEYLVRDKKDAHILRYVI